MSNIYRVIVCSIFFALPALAIVKPQHLSSHEPHGIVKILIRDANKDVVDQCSGISINDAQVLTAGHCSGEDIDNSTLEVSEIDGVNLTVPLHPLLQIRPKNAKNLDLMILNFKAKTFSKYSRFENIVSTNLDLKFYGYGTHYNIYFGDVMAVLERPESRTLHKGASQFNEITNDEIIFRSQITSSFATNGDSGGPVFNNDGSLQGIMITQELLSPEGNKINENDISADEVTARYMVENRAIRLTSTAALDFLKSSLQY